MIHEPAVAPGIVRLLGRPHVARAELARRHLLDFANHTLALVADDGRWQATRFHRHLCARLEAFSRAVEQQQGPRLVVMAPPRHGKTLLASVGLPVWHMARCPGHKVIFGTYSKSLAREVSEKARTLAADPVVQDVFPALRPARERKVVTDWKTTAGSGYLAAGVGGGITGRGAHLFIVDDPVKDAEQAHSLTWRERVWKWYTSTARTRLAPGGGVLVIMTRWHTDDLVGRLLKQKGWEVLDYPALAGHGDLLGRAPDEALDPGRFPAEDLAGIREDVGSWVWSALYQQRPVLAEGGIIQRKWFAHWSPGELPPRFDAQVISWDLTFGSTKADASWAVGQVWGRSGATKYLLAETRLRGSFPRQVAAVAAMAAEWPDARPILVEDAATGRPAVDVLRGKLDGVVPVKPEGSKADRLRAVAVDFEAGQVLLPPADRPWVAEWMDEVSAAPDGGPFNDRADAAAQALLRLRTKPALRLEMVDW